MTAEHRRLEAARTRTTHWKRWGPYVSDRAWGTVREDYSAGRHGLGVPAARSRPVARLPLERGRPGGDLRPPPGALPRPGAVERPRPDPEGAAVRPHRQRGQPRRGRQGVLLPPRLDADALVHADALQVSAGGVPVQRPGRREPAPRPRRARVRADRHRRLRRRSLLRRVRRVRQGRLGRSADEDHGGQPRPRGGGDPRAADDLVPQHVGLGRTQPARPLRGPPARPGQRHASPPRPCATAAAGSTPRATPTLLFTENETNAMRLFGIAGPLYAKDGIDEARRARTRRRREPGAHRHQGRRRLRARRSPAGEQRQRPPALLAARSRGLRRGVAVRRLRRHDDGAPARGRRVLRHRHPARPHRRRPRRDAPEPGRPAVVEAVLPLRREDVARGRPGAAGAAAGAPARTQRAVGPPVQRRRHLDAGQVGVPVVRRVGPGVPLRAAGASSTPSSPRTSSC